jgi:hypothetical protein
MSTPNQRLLKLKEAAEYCGLPPRNFRKHIRIAPVRLGPHDLWDKKLLDTYIDNLQHVATVDKKDWRDEVENF